MEDTLEIWEFTDDHPSGKEVQYQLEKRGEELSIHSDDPEFARRRAKCSGDRVLEFLHYLVLQAGEQCSRQTIEDELWKGAEVGIVETYLSILRKLLNDDTSSNRRGNVLRGRIVQSLKNGCLLFVPKVKRTPVARIQKTSRLGAFSSVPPLVNYIERPEISEPLIQDLISGPVRAVGLTAMEGMGGIGKTILAIAACHDSRVRSAFSDGIFWFQIRRESKRTFGHCVETICRLLNHSFDAYSKAAYQTLLQDKAVLVVLDDVWKEEDIEPFLVTSPRSRILFTTRNKAIASSLRVERRHEIGELIPTKARYFLEYWSGREHDSPGLHASAIVDECGGLALALSMIGALLRALPDEHWARVLADLKKAKLSSLAARLAGYEHNSLHASLSVSIDALPQAIRTYYLRLAVLLEGMVATTPMLQALWGLERNEILEISQVLIERCLARADNDGLRLHDFQLKYIRSEHMAPDALELQLSALRRSYHVLDEHPEQFSAQLSGRLLAHSDRQDVGELLEQLKKNTPCPRLRPLWPTLEQAAGPVQQRFDKFIENDLVLSQFHSLEITLDGRRAVSGHPMLGEVVVWDVDRHITPRFLAEINSDDSIKIGGSTDGVAPVITPDGRRLVYPNRMGDLVVWNLDGHQQPSVLMGVGCRGQFALTPDGKKAVCAGSEDLTVWDLDRQRIVRRLRGLDRSIEVMVTPDCKRAVSVSWEHWLRVWDLDSEAAPRCLRIREGRYGTVVITPDAKRAVIINFDHLDCSITVWDLDGHIPPRHQKLTGTKPLAMTPEGGGALWTVHGKRMAVTADGKCGISSCFDGSLIVWDLDGDIPPYRLELGRAVGPVILTPDGRRAVAGSFDDGSLIVWDLAGQTAPRRLDGPNSVVQYLAVTTNGERAVTAHLDRTVTTWDLNAKLPSTKGHCGEVTTLALNPSGNHVISGADDNTLTVWDLEGHQLRRLKTQTPVLPPPEDLEWHLSVIGEWERKGDHTVVVWDLQGEHPPSFLRGPISMNNAVSVAPDGRHVVSCHGVRDRTSDALDQFGRKPPMLPSERDAVLTLAMTRDNKRVVAGFADGHISVWDVGREGLPHRLLAHGDSCWTVGIAPDCGRAVTGSANGSLLVWDLGSLKSKILVRADAGPEITALGLTPNGQYAVVADAKGGLMLWDLEAGVVRRRLKFQTKWVVRSMAVTHDGNHVALAAMDGTITVLNVESNRDVATFTCDAPLVQCGCFGEYVAAGDSQGRVYLFAFER